MVIEYIYAKSLATELSRALFLNDLNIKNTDCITFA